MNDFVLLNTYLHRHEAEMAKGLLDEQGIVCMIDADDFGGEGVGMMMGQVRLLVPEEQLQKARQIIAVMDQGGNPEEDMKE